MSLSRGLAALAAALRARVRLIAGLALAGAFAGFMWSLADEPEYVATATVIVADRGEATKGLGGGLVGGNRRVAAERLLELAQSEDVATLAAASLGGDVSGADIVARTEFEPGDRNGTLIVRSTASFPDFAAAAANAYAASIVEFAATAESRRVERARQRLENELEELEGPEELEGLEGLEEPASAPEEAAELNERLDALSALEDAGAPLAVGAEAELPVEPIAERSTPAWTLGGLGAGALLGVLFTLGGEVRRRPLRTPAQVEASCDAPLLGILGPRDAARPTRRAGVYEIDPVPADRLHRLAQELSLPTDAGPPTLTVASPMPGEGRTTVALGLAAAAASEGVNVILVEADMRRPAVASLLGIERGPGLSDYLAGAAVPREVTNAIPVARGDASGELAPFVVVTAGTRLDSPAAMLSSNRFRTLVDQLARVYDLVIFDSPALLPAPEAAMVSEATDATVLCARAGLTRRSELTRAQGAVGGRGELGIVLVGTEHDRRSLRRLGAGGGRRFAKGFRRA